MGTPIGSSIPATQSAGKGSPSGNTVTTPNTSAQPSYGAPANYSNTIQPWDNAQIGGQSSGSGKGSSGKGASQPWQPFQASWTPPDTSAINPQTLPSSQQLVSNYADRGFGNGNGNR
jgi:hypothetical protein